MLKYPNLEKVDMHIKTTTFAICYRVYEAFVGFAKNIGWWVNEAFAIAVLLTKAYSIRCEKRSSDTTYVLWKGWEVLVAL